MGDCCYFKNIRGGLSERVAFKVNVKKTVMPSVIERGQSKYKDPEADGCWTSSRDCKISLSFWSS